MFSNTHDLSNVLTFLSQGRRALQSHSGQDYLSLLFWLLTYFFGAKSPDAYFSAGVTPSKVCPTSLTRILPRVLWAHCLCPWFAFASRFPPTLCPQIFPKVCHPMSPWVVTFLKFINTRVISLCSPSGLWTPANGVQKLWVKNNGSTFFYWFPLLHNMLSGIAQSFSQVLFASFWDKKCDRRHRQTGANGPLLDAAL